MYIIKQQPEDFVVKEISNVEMKDEGRFIYFKLKKTKRNTLDVVKELAKQLKIKEKQIGFAGTKDKQAVTEQIISVLGVSKGIIEDKINIDNTELKFVGYGDKPISLGDLEGNSFEIIVRNLTEVKINKTSFVENYFDEQRFSKNNVNIGRYLIKKKFGAAVKLIDDFKVKEHLKKYGNDFIGALKKLSLRLLRIYVHAYQSYLWNEIVVEYLKCKKDVKQVIKEVDYSLGKFVFVTEKEDLVVPLIGFATNNFDEKIKPLIEKIMQKEELKYVDFIIKQIPELSLEGDLRKVFVEVKDLKISKTEDDELNKGKKKVKINFSLPKGSYATMVVKKIFTSV